MATFRRGPPNRVVDRLGSGVRVSASFQIFALTAGGMSWMGREALSGRHCPGDISRGNVLHSMRMAWTHLAVSAH